ncbi:MAG: hypothetical protein H6883_15115 [Rhodobiaceae bacterium]|nr:hypothetical protein [Rhodobiaceae bacterium]
MSAPVRYQFDKVFALDAAKTPEPPKMDVIAAETQARQARQDGFEEGRAAAAADQAARAAAALEKLVAALPALQQQAEAATRRMQADACRIGHAIAVKLAGALVAREPLAGIEALLAQTLAELQGVPHLVIRVNEALADTLKEKAEAQARLSGFDGRLIVMGEPNIRPGDARIEWAEGGIVRDMAGIEEAIGEAVSRFLGAGVSRDRGDDGQ